ncbi:MAG: FHA domain-containing protein, partial [Pseudomonadota bacterium]
MYRLICISGQSSSRSFILKEGENLIGRADGSDIKISSNGVSKKHAMVVVSGDVVYITDLGSKNGTFVNGVLVKRKEVADGDKIAIHDHVYQLMRGDVKLDGFPNVSPIESGDVPGSEDDYKAKMKSRSPGIKGSIDHFFETTIMPFFEVISKKYSISSIITVVTLSVVIAITFIVTVPIVQFDRVILDQEAAQRAVYLSGLLAQQNKDTVGVESSDPPSVKAAEDVEGVKWAVITDTTGRVLAPTERAGDQLPGAAIERIKKILSGTANLKEDAGRIGANTYKVSADVYSLGLGEYLVTSPIKAYSQEEDKFQYTGFAVLSFTTAGIQHSLAGAWQRIFVGMAIACFIGLILATFLSRLFNIPFVRIYDDVDLALKGEAKRVSFSFGSREGMDLIELLNILIRKSRRAAVKGAHDHVPESLGHDMHGVSDNVAIFDSVGKSLKLPFFVLDSANSIVSANDAFTNISTYKTL